MEFNVYTGKDGRLRVYIKDTKRVKSYPKFLMEKYLGRELHKNEQVHHKDGNPLNNDISNLEVRLLDIKSGSSFTWGTSERTQST